MNDIVDLQKRYIIVDGKNPNSDKKNKHNILAILTDENVITRCTGEGGSSTGLLMRAVVGLCESIAKSINKNEVLKTAKTLKNKALAKASKSLINEIFKITSIRWPND